MNMSWAMVGSAALVFLGMPLLAEARMRADRLKRKRDRDAQMRMLNKMRAELERSAEIWDE